MKAYDKVVEQSNRAGWPTVFRSDLFFHDREILRQIPTTQSFGWILRECGTEFVSPYQTPDSWGTMMIKVYANRGKFFWYDGYRLMEVEPENLRGLVLRFYQEQVRMHIESGDAEHLARVKAKQETDAMHNKLFENVVIPDLPGDWTEAAA